MRESWSTPYTGNDFNHTYIRGKDWSTDLVRNSSFAADFYDEIAGFIPGYTPSSGRGDFNAVINLPTGAGVTKAVLSQNKADMQDNVDYSES